MNNPVQKSKFFIHKSLRLGFIGLGLFAILANNAKSATLYFDINGPVTGYGVANGGNYSWDGPNWATASGGTVTTGNWIPGSFADFPGAANYTVTVNNDELMAGMNQAAASGNTLTINGAGSGALDIVPGDQGFLVGSGAGATLIINAPITGSGGLAPENAGSLYINGNNTYSGGTTFGYASTPLTYFNNNNSFGTGAIKVISGHGGVAPLLSYGGSTITLPNAFDSTAAAGPSAGFNFANGSYTPVVTTGNFTLGANAGLIKNDGDTTAPLTIKGNINSSGTVTFAGNNGGKIYVSGANAGLTGTVAIGANSGQANVIVSLSAANTLSAAAKVSMVNGTLDFGGLTHNMGSTTLALGASGVSTLDFESGATASFANSSTLSWTVGGILNLANYDNGLYVGIDATGLTSAQLADIEFAGNQLGDAAILSNGEIVDAPEPSSIALGLLGGLGMMWSIRRRKA